MNLQKSVCNFEIPIKSYGQNSKKGTKETFFGTFSNTISEFVHNFFLKDQNDKRIFGDGS